MTKMTIMQVTKESNLVSFKGVPSPDTRRHTWVLIGPDSNKCSSQAIKVYINILTLWK